MRNGLRNGALAFGALLVALLLIEGPGRLFLPPVATIPIDLSSQRHPRLHHVIYPGQAGHDANGFRNHDPLAQRYDIVCIGDSLTYGMSASQEKSYPAQLAALTGSSVYNLALGGYGPVQYRELLETIGVSLKPKTVIIGFFFGNDLYDAFRVVAGNKNWDEYSELLTTTTFSIAKKKKKKRGALKTMLKLLTTHSVILSRLKLLKRMGENRRLRPPSYWEEKNRKRGELFYYPYNDGQQQTVFTPSYWMQAMDQNRSEARDGLIVSIQALEDVRSFCARSSLDCRLLLLPTKERVFAQRVKKRDKTLYKKIEAEVVMERRVEAMLREALAGWRIITPLKSLRAALDEGLPIYPFSDDGHPNKNGYGVIAQTVAAALRGATQ